MSYTVLAVDDDAMLLWMLTALIEQDPRLGVFGTAGDGREAVERVRQGCPDSIVCDVRMPVMDGLEALPLLRRACPACVIVVYSSEPGAAGDALRVGADEVVDKAGDPTALLDLIVDLCAARSQG
jgi:DNA-binding NarL/FixJ family response regulator